MQIISETSPCCGTTVPGPGAHLLRDQGDGGCSLSPVWAGVSLVPEVSQGLGEVPGECTRVSGGSQVHADGVTVLCSRKPTPSTLKAGELRTHVSRCQVCMRRT